MVIRLIIILLLFSACKNNENVDVKVIDIENNDNINIIKKHNVEFVIPKKFWYQVNNKNDMQIANYYLLDSNDPSNILSMPNFQINFISKEFGNIDKNIERWRKQLDSDLNNTKYNKTTDRDINEVVIYNNESKLIILYFNHNEYTFFLKLTGYKDSVEQYYQQLKEIAQNAKKL